MMFLLLCWRWVVRMRLGWEAQRHPFVKSWNGSHSWGFPYTNVRLLVIARGGRSIKGFPSCYPLERFLEMKESSCLPAFVCANTHVYKIGNWREDRDRLTRKISRQWRQILLNDWHVKDWVLEVVGHSRRLENLHKDERHVAQILVYSCLICAQLVGAQCCNNEVIGPLQYPL